jgi:hypothetical protein
MLAEPKYSGGREKRARIEPLIAIWALEAPLYLNNAFKIPHQLSLCPDEPVLPQADDWWTQ